MGHAQTLQQAASLGDVLIVGVNSDASVRRQKGPDRPVIHEANRAAMLAALGCVTHVVIFADETPRALLRSLKPHVLVKGGTYTTEEVVGREVVEAYGGEVRVVGSQPEENWQNAEVSMSDAVAHSRWYQSREPHQRRCQRA